MSESWGDAAAALEMLIARASLTKDVIKAQDIEALQEAITELRDNVDEVFYSALGLRDVLEREREGQPMSLRRLFERRAVATRAGPARTTSTPEQQ